MYDIQEPHYNDELNESAEHFDDEFESDNQFANLMLICISAVVAGLTLGYAILSAPPKTPPIPYATPAGQAMFHKKIGLETERTNSPNKMTGGQQLLDDSNIGSNPNRHLDKVQHPHAHEVGSQ